MLLTVIMDDLSLSNIVYCALNDIVIVAYAQIAESLVYAR